MADASGMDKLSIWKTELEEENLVVENECVSLTGRAFEIVPDKLYGPLYVESDLKWAHLVLLMPYGVTDVERELEREGKLLILDDNRIAIERQCSRSGRSFTFELDGKTITWDINDMRPRWCPDVDWSNVSVRNPWVSVIDDKVIRVKKTFAYINLSRACIASASDEQGDRDGWFDWYISDSSHYPLTYERPWIATATMTCPGEDALKKLLNEHVILINKLMFFNCGYFRSAGILWPDDYAAQKYCETVKKPVVEPLF